MQLHVISIKILKDCRKIYTINVNFINNIAIIIVIIIIIIIIIIILVFLFDLSAFLQ